MATERDQQNQTLDLRNYGQMIIDKINEWATINRQSFDMLRRIKGKEILTGKTLLPRVQTFWLVSELADSNTTQVQRFATDLEQEDWYNPKPDAEITGRRKGKGYTIDQTSVILSYTVHMSQSKTNGLEIDEAVERKKEEDRQKLLQNLKIALEGVN